MTDPTSPPTVQPIDAISGTWRLDKQRSSVEFRTRSLWGLVAVRGHFEDYEGSLDLAASPAIELTIAAASLQTGNRKRDHHLRTGDFFDAEHHPQVRFVSESVEPDAGTDADALRVRGRLTARGRSIPLEATAQIRRTGTELELDAAVTVPHRQLGMTWNFLRAISPHSRLSVKGRLTPAA